MPIPAIKSIKLTLQRHPGEGRGPVATDSDLLDSGLRRNDG